MPTAGQPADAGLPAAENLKERIAAFVRKASMEITPADEKLLPEMADLLPKGTAIYIAHPPNTTLKNVVKAALAVQRAGFTAAPHIVARRINYPHTLRTALAELRTGGVEQLLLVAGDGAQISGEFASTLDVLNSGVLEESGINRVDVAGYPEGQKSVGATLLWDALVVKHAYAARTGIEMQVVTQFGLNGKAVGAWEAELARRHIVFPVHVGIAGPTSLPRLIHFAMSCGIGASLRAVMHNLSAASGITELAISPDKHVMCLMDLPAGTQVVAPHFFGFGGTLQTARWIQRVGMRKFNLDSSAQRFSVEDQGL